MRSMLEMHVPFLPPSNNKSYINIRGRGRRLSPQAEKFKADFIEYVTKEYSEQLASFTPEKESTIVFGLTTYFPDIKTKTDKAKYPYSRKDVLWGAKMVQDVVATILGQDDLFHFSMPLCKKEGEEGMDIFVLELSYDESMTIDWFIMLRKELGF